MALTTLVPGRFEEEVLPTLRSSTLFDSAADADLHTVARACRVDAVPANTLVLGVGDEANDVFLLIDGELLAYAYTEDGDELPLRRISGQGAFFGEIAFLSTPRSPRTANIRTVADCHLLRVPGDTFTSWLQRDQALETRLRETAAAQIRETALRQVRLLRTLAAETDGEVLAERTYRAGEAVCKQGETGREMYVLLSGTARVFRSEPDGSLVQLVRLLPGQCFGELSLIDGKPRTASVVAENELRVIAVDERAFLSTYRSDPATREQFAALRGVYDYGHRGVAVRYIGTLFERTAMSTWFRLDDGRRVVAHKVVDADIWSIQQADDTADAVPFSFVSPDQATERTLLVRDDRLVGAVVKGPWAQIASVHGYVLEQVPVDARQIEAFTRTGVLEVQLAEAPATAVADPIVCECMRVSRSVLLQAVSLGCTTVQALSERTGAGTVCGGCQPRLAELTNEQLWQSVAIAEVIERTPEVRSFRLPIPPTHWTQRPQPGQHLVVRATIGGVEVQRTYTLSSAASDLRSYEITVKLEPSGAMSSWLFEHGRQGARLDILPPSGWCFFDLQDRRPLVCLVGGIGITPALSVARTAHAVGALRPIHLDYSAPYRDQMVCGEELTELATDLPSLSVRLRATRDEGRLNAEDVAQLAARFVDADFLVCGSKPFQHEVQSHLRAVDTPEHRIHIESFDAVGNGATATVDGRAVPAASVVRPERWRARIAYALLIGLAVFLAQALLNWHWPLLQQLQSVTTWSAATGIGLVAVYLLQWRLPYVRWNGRLSEIARAYNLHIWLGPALLGLMLLHTTSLGYRLSLVLTLVFVFSLATGALISAIERSRSRGKLRTTVLGLHIAQSVAVLGLAAAHGTVSLWY